jgi:hypothetical protein
MLQLLTTKNGHGGSLLSARQQQHCPDMTSCVSLWGKESGKKHFLWDGLASLFVPVQGSLAELG